MLVVKAAVPQQNFLGVLVDDSRSMQIADVDGQPRSAFVKQHFASPEADVLKALSSRFVLRSFRFSSSAQRLASPAELAFAGAQTKIGAALDGARQELAGLPLAGLVLVTDGADTTDAELSDALLAMKAADVPVFTVGLGRESLTKDVQIDRVSTPAAALKGTSLMVDALVTQTGYAGETVTLDVEDEGRIVGSQEVKLPIDGEPATVRVRFTASDAGPRVFRFRIAPRAGELVTQNNQRESLVDVYDRTEKILYFEGEPRPELKFLHRAVDDDKNLQVVTLLRTADNKYYRLLLDTPDQLLGGFPKTRDELFAYRGLILGSIEAGAFTGDQLRMIGRVRRAPRRRAAHARRRPFVLGRRLCRDAGRRCAAGRRSSASTRSLDTWPVSRLKVRPTRAGEGHALAQIAPTEAASLNRWNDLPTLISVNADQGREARRDGAPDRHRREARHAAGAGVPALRPRQGAGVHRARFLALADAREHSARGHDARELLASAPPLAGRRRARGRSKCTRRPTASRPASRSRSPPTSSTTRSWKSTTRRWSAKVTGPGGEVIDVPMQWTGERNGQYRGTFVSGAPGMYATKVEASREGKALGSGQTHVRAAPGDAEYFDATMHAARLQRIAEETGGRFYTPETMGTLAEDLKYTGRGVTTVEERDLWHMPIILLLLVGLTCAEWGYRQSRGDGVRIRGLLLLTLLLAAAPADAQVTHLAVIVGLAGEPEHAELFTRWAGTLIDASAKLGVEDVIYLAEKPEADAKRVTGRSTRDEVVKAFDKLATAGEDDVVFIVLIGHGTFDGKVAKFNLPGPDLTPADFEPLLKKVRSRHVVFVNTASASGPFIEALAGSGPDDCDGDAHRRRAVCDALWRLLRRRAGGDRRRLRQEPADLGARGVHLRQARSRDGVRARRDHVDRACAPQRQRRGRAFRIRRADGKQGKVAAVLSLGSVASTDPLPADPKLRALYLERRDLERRIEALKLLKGSMPAERYAGELEKMATDLALKTRQIRELEKK